MSTARTLGDIAHARAGDKGDSSILFLAPYAPSDFALVRAVITAERLAEHFEVSDATGITVRAVEELCAFSIVIPHRLDGGVTRSTTADPPGKTLSGHLLSLELDR